MDPIPGGAAGIALRGFGMVSDRVIGALRSIFGAAPNDNESPAYYGCGTGGIITLGATVGATASGGFQVDAGSDFVATRITKIDTDASGVVLTTVASYTAQFTYTGSQRNLVFLNSVHANAIMGDGFQSVPLAKNWLIRRSATISAGLTNLKAVAAVSMIAFHGYAVFDPTMLDRTGRR